MSVENAIRRSAGAPISDLEALSCLYEVGNYCANAGAEFDKCLGAIVDAAIFVTGADKGTLQLLNPETGTLVIRAQRGFHQPFLDFFSQVEDETAAVCGAALSAMKRVVVEDVLTSELFAGEPAAAVLLAEGVRAVQSTPLMSSSELVFGMFSTHFARPTRLGPRELRFIDLLARQAADFVERKKMERQLVAKELQLERITSQVSALITQCSRDLRYVFVNKPCADFLGKPVELIVGRSIREVLGEAAFQVIRPYVERVLAGERVEYETEIPYADVGLRHVHVVYVPDLDPQGLVCGWIGTINDITERKRLEQHLRAADRQKDEFLAMLAHELRNPLAPIRYALAAVKKSGGTPEHQARAGEVIERQVTHMTRLLDDLLDVSRITRGRLELQKSPTELSAVLADALEAVRPVLDAKQHEVAIELPRGRVVLEADSVRLAQVFSNLLINAAKYTDAGGRIQLRAFEDSAQVVVAVRDNGIGISPELMPRLFTLFTQGSTALDRAEGGLGVGLALARGIVELHGGSVEVSSDGPNQGSEFTVRLPLAPQPQSRDMRLEPQRHAGKAGLKILVVDDNRDAADTCATLLALSGHVVQTAYSGRRALALAEIFRPHAFLLDIGMTDMDGYELSERIRAAAWGRQAVLVAVSGWGREEDRRRAFAAGFDHHLTKPVTDAALEALLQSVSRAVARPHP
jgi:PAS domain S-box-containing protein